MDFKVRLASHDDRHFMRRAVSALCEEAKCSRFWRFDPESVDAIMSIGREAVCSLVVECDGAPVGGLLGVLSPVPFAPDVVIAQEMALHVTPEFRGHGAGGMLLDAFRDWARERGAVLISCGNNFGCADEPIRKLAEKHGMTKTEVIYVGGL
jgi:GNAT superfamily N-acetyltransferase